MQHVNALSRAHVDSCDENLETARIFNLNVHEDEILIFQRRDEELLRKITILEKKEKDHTRREKGDVQDFLLRNRLLYKKDFYDKNKELYVVPKAMRKALVIITTLVVISVLIGPLLG